MIPLHLILTLPIQKRSYDSYYKDEEIRIAKDESSLREYHEWHGGVSEEVVERDKSYGQWPSWALNDTIGFLQVGVHDWGNALLGVIFLKRRCHPKEEVRHSGVSLPSLPSRRDQFHYWRETKEQWIDPAASHPWVDAAEAMTREAQLVVRQNGRGCRRAVVIRPSFGFDGLNWPLAILNAKRQTD